jgi:hypothetical protein
VTWEETSVATTRLLVLTNGFSFLSHRQTAAAKKPRDLFSISRARRTDSRTMSDVGEKRENPDGGSQPNRKRKKVRFLRRARRPVAEGTPRGTRGTRCGNRRHRLPPTPSRCAPTRSCRHAADALYSPLTFDRAAVTRDPARPRDEKSTTPARGATSTRRSPRSTPRSPRAIPCSPTRAT